MGLHLPTISLPDVHVLTLMLFQQDRVLSAASHFADQIKELHACVTFTDGTTGLVYGQCLLLLELGDENAETLEKAFQLWYSFGVDLRPLLR